MPRRWRTPRTTTTGSTLTCSTTGRHSTLLHHNTHPSSSNLRPTGTRSHPTTDKQHTIHGNKDAISGSEKVNSSANKKQTIDEKTPHQHYLDIEYKTYWGLNLVLGNTPRIPENIVQIFASRCYTCLVFLNKKERRR